jgi:hypothetical protein
MVLVSVVLPCVDFAGEDFLVGDAAVQTLGSENAELGFGHIEPAAVLGRVMPVIAPTGSCATPVGLSPASAFSLVRRVLAGCTQSLLPPGACRVGEDVAILIPHR